MVVSECSLMPPTLSGTPPFLCQEPATTRVLLVEDNPMLQYLHRSFLEELGYSVDIATSGEMALALFHEDYQLVLMDIDLPGMNGIETVRALFKNFPEHAVPIIACTSHEKTELQSACFSVGMVDYLQKPVSSARLQQTLAAHMVLGVRYGQ
ncbi:MAG: response regulator [Gammaproteobacteria bacterium]|nr:response regulator [Gammaproteobacteria bacterium]